MCHSERSEESLPLVHSVRSVRSVGSVRSHAAPPRSSPHTFPYIPVGNAPAYFPASSPRTPHLHPAAPLPHPKFLPHPVLRDPSRDGTKVAPSPGTWANGAGAGQTRAAAFPMGSGTGTPTLTPLRTPSSTGPGVSPRPAPYLAHATASSGGVRAGPTPGSKGGMRDWRITPDRQHRRMVHRPASGPKTRGSKGAPGRPESFAKETTQHA
jgi:hypothetical protein